MTEAALATPVPVLVGQLLFHVHCVAKGTRPRVVETRVKSVLHLGQWVFGFGFYLADMRRFFNNVHLELTVRHDRNPQLLREHFIIKYQFIT